MEITTLSLFDLAAWLNFPAKTLWDLTTHPDEPLPVYDSETMQFYRPDVIEWLHRLGLAAPDEDPIIL